MKARWRRWARGIHRRQDHVPSERSPGSLVDPALPHRPCPLTCRVEGDPWRLSRVKDIWKELTNAATAETVKRKEDP